MSEGLRCEPSEVQIGSKYSLIAAEVFYCKLGLEVHDECFVFVPHPYLRREPITVLLRSVQNQLCM